MIFLMVSGIFCSCGYKTNPRPTAARVPAEIRIITARGYPNDITLNWKVPQSNSDGSKLTDLSGFKVYRGSRGLDEDCENCQEKRQLHANIDFQFPSNATIKDNEVTFRDKDVSLGKVYTYAVSAYNMRGHEGRIGGAVEVFYEAPPDAPTNLTAKPEAGHIRLEWTAPADGKIDRYEILRGDGKDVAKMKTIGTALPGEPWFVDKNVEKNSTYFYAVRSVKSYKGTPIESNTSNIAEALAPSIFWGSPENVNVAMSNRGIRIYWNPVKIENEETRYNVYRSESGRVFEQINPDPISTPWFVDTKVTRGRSYRYAVTAFPKDKPDEESARTASQAIRYTY
ncbi:MAG: fibronectin type III domain-containing protein [Desulfomonilaceae bacterium]